MSFQLQFVTLHYKIISITLQYNVISIMIYIMLCYNIISVAFTSFYNVTFVTIPIMINNEETYHGNT